MSESDDHPPTPAELERWTAALRGPFMVIVQFIIDFLAENGDATDRLERMLLHILAHTDEGEIAAGVSRAATIGLSGPGRTRVLLRSFTEPRAALRRAVFEHWMPLRFTVPRADPAPLPEPEWTHVMRQALRDGDPQIRKAATGLVFETDIGAGVVPELLANLDEPDTTLRWLSLLALRSATDSASLQALRAALHGDEVFLASAAVRALAARPDGQAEFRRALEDPRPDVQSAARYALAWGDRRL